MSLSVVVPVYNSSKILGELVNRVENALSGSGLSFEIILADDASPDSSWNEITELCYAKKHVVGLRLKKNTGQWFASLVGMSKARGRYIVTIDDDLEYAPEDILKLYQQITSRDLMVVFGMAKEKYEKKGQNQFISKGRNRLLNFFWQKNPTESFKILKREFVFSSDNFLPEIHFEAFQKKRAELSGIGFCSVEYHKRLSGSSNHPFFKKVRLFFLFTRQHWGFGSSKISNVLIAETFNLTT